MNINGIIYFLIVLFSFILLHSFFTSFFTVREGIDDCLVNTLADLKIEVAELKTKIDGKTSQTTPQNPSAEETGNFLLSSNLNDVGPS
jgi:hypothetical protein